VCIEKKEDYIKVWYELADIWIHEFLEFLFQDFSNMLYRDIQLVRQIFNFFRFYVFVSHNEFITDTKIVSVINPLSNLLYQVYQIFLLSFTLNNYFFVQWNNEWAMM